MAARFAGLLTRFSEMVGLDKGIVEDESEEIVERSIESVPVSEETKKTEKKETIFTSRSRIEEEDLEVSSDSDGKLFGNRKNDEDIKAEETQKAQEEKSASIQRSERRLMLASLQREREEKKTTDNEVRPQYKRGESEMGNVNDSQKINLCVARPTEFSIESCKEICSNLRAQRMVTINFEDVKSNDDKCRIYDFVCGCCVALDCKLEKVSREVYIATPFNAKVYKMGEKEEVANNQEAYSFN